MRYSNTKYISGGKFDEQFNKNSIKLIVFIVIKLRRSSRTLNHQNHSFLQTGTYCALNPTQNYTDNCSLEGILIMNSFTWHVVTLSLSFS